MTWPDIKEMFLSELRAEGRHPLTVWSYGRIINELERLAEDIRQITKEQIAVYAEAVLLKKIALDGKIHWLCRLKMFFAWAVATRLILADPAARIRLPKCEAWKYPPYISRNEIARLLDAIQDPHDRAMLELLYSTGIRSGELRKLTEGNINWQDGTITVLLGKNRKDRVVPVGRVALHWLERRLQQEHGYRPDALLFPVSEHHLCTVVRRYARAAGIQRRFLPHSFRHCFAVHLLENGASIRHIQAMLGHESLCTTQRYTQVVSRELVRAHRKFHPCRRRPNVKLPDVFPVLLF